MTDMHPVTQADPAREVLRCVSDENGLLAGVIKVFELVAHSSVGLGEVLQDYARQGCSQLHDIIRSARNLAQGTADPDDVQTIKNAYFVLGTVQSALKMIPAAMQRNKAETIGGNNELSLADIAAATQAFVHSPDIAHLLSAEECGRIVLLMTGTDTGEAQVALKQGQGLIANH